MNALPRVWEGPSARRTPPRSRARPILRIALAAMALGAIGLEGCQSFQTINPFRGGGGGGCCGGGLGGLFRRDRVTYGAEPPIYTDPGVEVLPGAPLIEGEPIGGYIDSEPAFTSPPTVAPPSNSRDDATIELDPLPDAGVSRNSSGSVNSRAGATPKVGDRSRGGSADPSYRFGGASLYGDAYADRMARRSEATASSPDGGVSPPTSPPAERPEVEEPQSLENFPTPLAVLPPAGEQDLPPLGIAPNPAPPSSSATMPEAESPPSSPPPEPDASNDSASNHQVPSAPPTGVAEGTAPFFQSVDPQLAGGKIPDEQGWATLAEHGYRTVLDLRPIAEVRPDDFAASARHGIRHIPLPMTPGVIDDAIVDRFEREIAHRDARPIVFADRDGTGAAAIWYVHRAEAEGYDLDRARRDAERIASIPEPLLQSANAYLNAGQDTLGASISFDDLQPFADAPTTDGPEPAPDPTPAAPAVAEVPDDPFAKAAPSPPKEWGPYAAFFLTVLVVPLAYWSTTTLPETIKTRVRASLSASSRRPLSIAVGSDAGS